MAFLILIRHHFASTCCGFLWKCLCNERL